MPSHEEATRTAADLMARFAERTGLTSERAPQRYLWTDAFAVCNLLALERRTGERRHAELALRLVDQVHHVLGRHRADDPRDGWLSGLSAQEGEAHPTRGGLRIGKPLRERAPEEPQDPELEWDRDGQYFHYLTKWMHALDQVARATGEARFHRWARELAQVAHAAFTRGAGAHLSMVWKLSVDLTRPLVPSMGQHDPLDGYVTCLALEAGAAPGGPDLGPALADLAAMTAHSELWTSDPLGLGGLLTDAWRLARLPRVTAAERDLVERLLSAAEDGLALHTHDAELRGPASRRLAFRELGLALGLTALEQLTRAVEAAPEDALAGLVPQLRALAPHAALGPALVDFWLEPAHQQARTWTGHRDINEVMLVTCLVPEGFLGAG